jgi:hypothetical protein
MGQGFLRQSTITGTVGNETLTVGTAFPQRNATWASFPENADLGFVPQLGVPSRIQANDARLENVVFRSGSLWTAHTVFTPVGSTPDTAVAQWWQITAATGAMVQSGRVETDGGLRHSFFPSIAVNAAGDMLMGYTSGGPNQYASAAYSFRAAGDAANTLRPTFIYKSGVASYFKTFGGSRNRWGDYSATVVDPVNDADFWTLQEYAELPDKKFDHWGTWWAHVVPGQDVPRFTIDDVTVNEGAGGGTINSTFTVQLSAPAAGETKVDFTTLPGSATTGSDFRRRVETLTFPAGTTMLMVDVVVNDDTRPEVNETFLVRLSNTTGGTAIQKEIGVGTIADDDVPAATNNDLFANARTLTGTSAADLSANVGASIELGEPFLEFAAQKTIWWKWTAADDGTVTVNTFGSALDTLLTAFTGDAVDQLRPVAFNDDGGDSRQSEIKFKAKAGTTYSFAVDAFAGAVPEEGAIVISLAAFAAEAAKFSGLAGTATFTGEDVGALDVKVSAKGTFTAKGVFNGRKFKFKGSLDANGRFSGPVKVKGLGFLFITLAVDVSGSASLLTGTINDGEDVSVFTLESAVSKPVTQAGQYTFAIIRDPSGPAEVPVGHGFGALKVSSKGSARFAGTLGDRTKFSGKGTVGAVGDLTMFALLYKGAGSISFDFTFADLAGTDFTGPASWAKPATNGPIQPAAFAARLLTKGSRYAKPQGAPIITADGAALRGGNLTADITRAISIDAQSKVTVTGSTEQLKLSFNIKSGGLTGSFVHPVTNKTSKISGMVFQKDNTAFGLFPGTDATGSVFLND